MIVVYIVLGVVLGAVIGVLFGRGQKNELAMELKVMQMKCDEANARIAEQAEAMQKQQETLKSEAKQQVDEAKSEAQRVLNETKTDFQNQIAEIKAEATKRQQEVLAEKEKDYRETMEAQEQRHKESFDAQKQRFDETLSKMTEQLKNTTAEMLKERQKEFSESSSTNLSQIVNPLKETIEKMNAAMKDSSESQVSLKTALQQRMEDLIKQSEAAKKSADELARVFKHSSKVQGDWGELVLDNLLASHGLQKGVHYDVQDVIRDAQGNVVHTETGGNMRPDVILHLDQKREVIIDSKVSLTAFMDYVNAETEEARTVALNAHINSLKKHVKELSEKDYSSYIRAPKVKMDYVIMFVPHSGALWTALNAQPDLWRKAMEQNVYIADEQTLYAALKIVHLTWTQIVQAQNHEEVYRLANEMLDRVGQFEKKYLAIGEALEKAQKVYEDGHRKLSESGQSIPNTCAKLIKLGARQSEKNKVTMIDVSDIPPVKALEEENQ